MERRWSEEDEIVAELKEKLTVIDCGRLRTVPGRDGKVTVSNGTTEVEQSPDNEAAARQRQLKEVEKRDEERENDERSLKAALEAVQRNEREWMDKERREHEARKVEIKRKIEEERKKRKDILKAAKELVKAKERQWKQREELERQIEGEENYGQKAETQKQIKQERRKGKQFLREVKAVMRKEEKMRKDMETELKKREEEVERMKRAGKRGSRQEQKQRRNIKDIKHNLRRETNIMKKKEKNEEGEVVGAKVAQITRQKQKEVEKSQIILKEGESSEKGKQEKKSGVKKSMQKDDKKTGNGRLMNKRRNVDSAQKNKQHRTLQQGHDTHQISGTTRREHGYAVLQGDGKMPVVQ